MSEKIGNDHNRATLRALAALAAAPQPKELYVDFPGIGRAGPFHVMGGVVTIPNATMRDLYAHRPSPEGVANTPIDELVARYTAEGCDFADIAFVRKAALRYVSTMADSQVRCLLYVLATAPQEQDK